MDSRINPIKDISSLNSWKRNKLNRSTCPIRDREKPVQKVLICHDFKGGYNLDSFIQGKLNPSEADLQSAYNFQYWQYCDIFVYFSHYRISVPPLTWINPCHINGVKCLGTIITEWDEGVPQLLQLIYGPNYNPLLPSTQMQFSGFYADILIEIAEYYGFDGIFNFLFY